VRRFARSLELAPALRRPAFRLLWLGWSISYAGDALQLLAQTWLIALLTNSALAVAGTPALATLPLLLLPLGGVVADAYDRRRLLLVTQLAGALSTGAIATLVAMHRITVWEIYAWVVFASVLRVVARPAYKALLTETVPAGEARSALALASMTETGSMVMVTGVGGVLLSAVGLTAAFVVNALSYVVAAWTLVRLASGGLATASPAVRLSARSAFADIRSGFRYLRGDHALLHPLVLTFAFVLATSPLFTLLAAVVHAHGDSLADLGLLAAATSLGTFTGAAYAGSRRQSDGATMRYARQGIYGAVALAIFALVPLGWWSLVPLAALGGIFGAQTVWNASRVAEVGSPLFQGRLQAITTMVLALGSGLAALWAGPVLDAFGDRGLLGAAGALAVVSVAAAVAIARRHRAVEISLAP
jgi:MFS family permease